MMHQATPDMPGAEQVVAWFGYWPPFHDAEVLQLHLNRRGVSILSVHAWRMTEKTHQSDGPRQYVSEKHAIVRFELAAISDLDLSGFSTQNVLAALHIERNGEIFHLRLEPLYGIGGRIDAGQCSVTFKPGEPCNE